MNQLAIRQEASVSLTESYQSIIGRFLFSRDVKQISKGTYEKGLTVYDQDSRAVLIVITTLAIYTAAKLVYGENVHQFRKYQSS